MPRLSTLVFRGLAALWLACSPAFPADWCSFGVTADYGVVHSDPPRVIDQMRTALSVGSVKDGQNIDQRQVVFVFDLPTLPAGERVTSARISFRFHSKIGRHTTPAQLYGLAIRENRAPLPVYAPAVDPAKPLPDGMAAPVLFQSEVLKPDQTSGSWVASADGETAGKMGAWLRQFYEQHPGYQGGSSAHVAIACAGPAAPVAAGYSLAAADNGTVPVLSIRTETKEPPAPSQKANFVVFVADDWVRPGTKVQTPRLDRLAAGSLNFQQAWSVHSLSSPSRAALLTGRPPVTIGIDDNQTPFPRDNRFNLPRRLRQEGWRTGLAGKYLMSNQSARYGFDSFCSYIGQRYTEGGTYFENGVPLPIKRPIDQIVVDYAEKFIDDSAQRPFFLMVAFKGPDGANDPLAAIAEIDGFVGRILDRIEARGLTDRTAVIFTSDGGPPVSGSDEGFSFEAFMQDPADEAAKVREMSLRVPLIVRPPQALAGKINVMEKVTLLDIAPTILKWADVPAGEEVEGRPLNRFTPTAQPKTATPPENTATR